MLGRTRSVAQRLATAAPSASRAGALWHAASQFGTARIAGPRPWLMKEAAAQARHALGCRLNPPGRKRPVWALRALRCGTSDQARTVPPRAAACNRFALRMRTFVLALAGLSLALVPDARFSWSGPLGAGNCATSFMPVQLARLARSPRGVDLLKDVDHLAGAPMVGLKGLAVVGRADF